MAYSQENKWKRLFRLEGGYVNDPDDPGGETKWGISKRSYPHLNIKTLSRQQAQRIYQRDYFEKPGYDRLPPLLADQMMDMAINLGSLRAGKLLQIVLGVTVDGIVGKETRKAIEGWDIEKLNNRLVEARKRFYREIVKNRPSSGKYLKGWLKRAEEFRV